LQYSYYIVVFIILVSILLVVDPGGIVDVYVPGYCFFTGCSTKVVFFFMSATQMGVSGDGVFAS
jgi:hypothetical protein